MIVMRDTGRAPELLVARRVPRPRFLRAGLEFGFSLVDHQIRRKQVSKSRFINASREGTALAVRKKPANGGASAPEETPRSAV